MKNTLKNRALSVILAVLMLVSAFAVCVPASAAETTAAETLESAFGKVLWSADFDYASAFEKGTATRDKLAAPTNGDSKFPLWTGGGASTGVNISATLTGSALQFNGGITHSNYSTAEGADNTFFDLIWGRTENTSYYMEFDFTPTEKEMVANGVFLLNQGATGTNPTKVKSLSGMSYDDVAALFNYDSTDDGVDNPDTYVNYKIDTFHRGQSFFSMQRTSGVYDELFKVNRNGYIYAPNSGAHGSVSIKSADNSEEVDYSSYTYNYYEAEWDEENETWSWVEKTSSQPLTSEVVTAMKSAYGEDFTMTWTNACTDYSKAYKLELGTTYKIRVDISVSGTTAKHTVYIRENHENAPWIKLGYRSSTILTETSGTAGTDYPYSCRVVENNLTRPIIDNWFFATYPANCDNGHAKPVVQSTHSVDGYKGVYTVKCEACGQIYYTYDKIVDTVFDYDFTTMTADEFAEAEATYNFIGSTFVEGEGLENLNDTAKRSGIWASIKAAEKVPGPVIVNMDKPYEIGFTVSFDSFPETLPISDELPKGKDPTGVSLFTDVTPGWNMLLRMGTHDIDGELTTEADTTKAWVKTRGAGGSSDWADAEATPGYMYLSLDTDYKFVIKVNGSDYEVYVNETLLGNSKMDFGSGDERSYRIGDAREDFQFTLKKWYVETEYDEYTPEIYDIFDETMGDGWNPVVADTMYPQANETAGFYVGNKDFIGANNNINDTALVLDDGSFAVNFDFMLPTNGVINANPSMSGNQFWSLLTWVSRNTNNADCYTALLSVGALDTNSDGTYDKHFLVPGKEAATTDKILVAADSATNEQKKNQSITVDSVVKHYIDDASIYDLTVGEWVNISLTFDATADMINIYINGEHVLTKYTEGSTALPSLSDYDLKSSYLRFGDGFSRRFKYNWALRNVELVPDSGYFNTFASPSAPAYVNDLGAANRKVTSNVSASLFGSRGTKDIYDPTIGGVTYSQVADTADAQGYTRYLASDVATLKNGSTKMMDLVKSTKNKYTGEYEEVLSSKGEKYSVDLTFAIPDRELTADEITALSAKYTSVDFTKEGYSTADFIEFATYSILRLSKWSDANQVRLLYCNHNGFYNHELAESGTWYFCDKAGNIYSPISELDENGRPLKMTTVKAVIDEWSNTYTLYINGELAYMKKNTTGTDIKPAANIAMKVKTNSGSLLNAGTYTGDKATYAGVYTEAPEYQAWIDSGKAYAMIPHSLTVTPEGGTETVVSHSGSYSNISYLRLFQASYEYIVESIEINKIKDSDVEYIGSQVKMASDAEATYDLRFVFGVDDLYASGISYHVTAEQGDLGAGEGVETEVDAKVYSSIVAGDKTVSADKYFEGNYFSVFKVEGVKVTTADTLYTFTITPYVTSASGTKVATGEVYTVQYNGLGQYVGCSVGTLAE